MSLSPSVWHYQFMARDLENLNQDQKLQLEYFANLFGEEPSPIFAESRAEAQKLGKTAIMISAFEGRMLNTLIGLSDCRHFVEIGSLTGYSSLWVLWSFKNSTSAGPARLATFEKNSVHAQVTRQILDKAVETWWPRGQRPSVEVIEGDAESELENYAKRFSGQVDGIFIDGNKAAYGKYLDWSEKHLKQNALILADNVFLRGQVYGASGSHFSPKQIQVMHKMNERLADGRRYQSFLIPSMEGLFVALKKF